MKKNIREKLAKIKMLILDVDGVMTDGRIIMDSEGREIKNFDVRDGHGIKMIQCMQIEVVLLTGRKSEVVLHRARDLGIKEVYQNARNKKDILEKILKKHRLCPESVAFLGDDIVDIPVLKRVGFPAAVANALDIVKDTAVYVTKRKGGQGAIREICDLILQAQNKWQAIASKYEFG